MSPAWCAPITHMGEITLESCRDALERQTLAPFELRVVSDVSPASAAFNGCLDFARQRRADILVHVAADCILRGDAVDRLAKLVQSDATYAASARGFDIMNGADSPIGAWALNMNVLPDRLRFRDTVNTDLDLCQQIERETGAVRAKTKRGCQLGYHHPIWRPREIFNKLRYNAQKYRTRDLNRHRDLLKECLRVNPGNKVLQVAVIALERGAAETRGLGAPVRDAFDAEWSEVLDIVDLAGDEFFAYHEDFIELARELLNSDQPIVPMAGRFFADANAPRRARRGLAVSLSSRAKKTLRPLYRKSRTRLLHLGLPIYSRLTPAAQAAVSRFTGSQPAKLVTRTLEAARQPTMEYGAQNVGRADWRERWNVRDRSRRVLLVAPKDFAGSMFKWAQAINQHTDFAARLIAFEFHPYGYPVDLIVPECDPKRLNAVMRLADEAGCLHLKDEHSWFLNEARFINVALLKTMFFGTEFAAKPKLFTHYGGYARKFRGDGAYIDAVRKFDARIAMTPDLNYPWFDGEYIPHSIDTTAVPYSWTDAKIFAHSPSSPEKKATYLFEEAVQAARQAISRRLAGMVGRSDQGGLVRSLHGPQAACGTVFRSGGTAPGP